jgi:hypothetical protein
LAGQWLPRLRFLDSYRNSVLSRGFSPAAETAAPLFSSSRHGISELESLLLGGREQFFLDFGGGHYRSDVYLAALQFFDLRGHALEQVGDLSSGCFADVDGQGFASLIA